MGYLDRERKIGVSTEPAQAHGLLSILSRPVGRLRLLSARYEARYQEKEAAFIEAANGCDDAWVRWTVDRMRLPEDSLLAYAREWNENYEGMYLMRPNCWDRGAWPEHP